MLFSGKTSLEPPSTRQPCRAVQEAVEAIGNEKRISPHTPRHSFATHRLEQDVDLRVIPILFGRTKPKTAKGYVDGKTA